MMLRNVHGLLGGPGALDGRVGQGEDGVALLEVLNGRKGFLDVVGVVVGADTWGLESFW